jgi:CheY-like chemotaxis protein
LRVLVVEDIPRHANRIAEGLRDQGIAVDVAYDGDEAASKLNVNPYDVVLLDRDLPGIHGDQLCQIITHREDPPMVLMLTAAGGPADRVKGLSDWAAELQSRRRFASAHGLPISVQHTASRSRSIADGHVPADGLTEDSPLGATADQTVRKPTITATCWSAPDGTACRHAGQQDDRIARAAASTPAM